MKGVVEMDTGSLEATFNQIINFCDQHPAVFMIAGGIILFLAIARASTNESTAGMYGVVIIACILFLIGLAKMTGMSLGMSF